MLAQLPVAVVMCRVPAHARWGPAPWATLAVQGVHDARCDEADDRSTSELTLELHRDENDGYFENWIAPAPKVFVLWQMQGERPQPIAASVSLGEGARMFDSGDRADGVPMPAFVYSWLGDYLQAYHRPPARREPRSSPRLRSD